MAQWLKTLAAPEEDVTRVAKIYMVTHSCLLTTALGERMPASGLYRNCIAHGGYTYTKANIHTHKTR